MVSYLFRNEADNENFALSIDVTGENIPPITPLTEWIFVEAIDTLKFRSLGISATSVRLSMP